MPATLYGSSYDEAYNNNGKFPPGELNGKVQTMYMEHEFVADVNAIGDIILMGKLPVGARVLGGKTKAPASGTTGIFHVGYPANGVDVADADGFDASLDIGAGAVLAELDGAAIGKKFTVETTVQIELTEATDSADGDTIQLWIHFIVD